MKIENEPYFLSFFLLTRKIAVSLWRKVKEEPNI